MTTTETATMLRDARLRAGLSQRQAARRAGLSPTVLSAYENGRREPSARMFRAVLTACGADLVVVDRWDSERSGRHFALVMEMTDHLPQRPRGKLTFPSLNRLQHR
jgi:transcriptional regulator with XRE-family HTH domain